MKTSMAVLLALCLGLGACAGRDQRGGGVNSAESLYESAQRRLASHDYRGAAAAFEEIESRFPFSVQAQQAQLELIYAHYKSGDHEQAQAASDRFLREQPRHPNIDYVHYLRGLINFDRSLNIIDATFGVDPAKRDLTLPRQAFQSFAILVSNYPQSMYAPDAQQRMIHLRNQMARHEMYVAEYYMRLGAWAGALGRARTVIEQYDETPSVVDALVVMHDAYRRLQMDELADDVARILAANHPEASGRLLRQRSR